MIKAPTAEISAPRAGPDRERRGIHPVSLRRPLVSSAA
ncbi:MAG: hypothetical protein QOH97_5037 [Actinoplanes sp.]|jgi:hypothetical protein|nr:hypothetical protein [Actinoplanes sp.]